MQTRVPLGRGLPRALPAKDRAGGDVWVCSSLQAQGKVEAVGHVGRSFWSCLFSAAGPGNPPRAVAAGRAVSARRGVPGVGGGSLAPLADLPGGLGCRVQSAASSGWGGFWVRAAARGDTGAQSGAGWSEAGLPAVVSARRHARGHGVSACLGGEGPSGCGGPGWGVSPQEPQMAPVSSSTQHSGKEGRAWGARSCWQGLFSKPWGAPTPSTAWPGRGAG